MSSVGSFFSYVNDARSHEPEPIISSDVLRAVEIRICLSGTWHCVCRWLDPDISRQRKGYHIVSKRRNMIQNWRRTISQNNGILGSRQRLKIMMDTLPASPSVQSCFRAGREVMTFCSTSLEMASTHWPNAPSEHTDPGRTLSVMYVYAWALFHCLCTYSCTYIQGVTGGTDQISGGCSLC